MNVSAVVIWDCLVWEVAALTEASSVFTAITAKEKLMNFMTFTVRSSAMTVLWTVFLITSRKSQTIKVTTEKKPVPDRSQRMGR